MNTHGIFVGRFQPVTTAHENIIKCIGMENEVATIFIVKGKMSSKNKELNPFDIDIQKEMLESIKPSNVTIKILPSAFFVDEINTYDDNKFIIYAGSDRIKSYEKFKGYMEGDKSLDTREINRNDSDVSASKVRKALTNCDVKTFKKLTPNKIHTLYDILKNINNTRGK